MTFPGKFEAKTLTSIKLGGEGVSAAISGAASAIKVLVRDGNGDILWATGAAVPADASDGYAKGCLFIDTDVAAGTTGLYVNVGTTTSANFDAVSDA